MALYIPDQGYSPACFLRSYCTSPGLRSLSCPVHHTAPAADNRNASRPTPRRPEPVSPGPHSRSERLL